MKIVDCGHRLANKPPKEGGRCPGTGVIFRDPKAGCPVGCRKYVYVYWWADPASKARKNPNEVCTKRWFKVFSWGSGPQPPAHRKCRCKRKFAFFLCLPAGKKPPVFSKRWDPHNKDFRERWPP